MRWFLLALGVFAQPAFATDLANGADIRAAIAGNTVKGSMQASGAYSEFYSPDGAIKAADYSGTWSVQGDKFCFAYGGDPASCWGVQISGNQVVWVGDGGEEGVGTIVPGNPNGF